MVLDRMLDQTLRLVFGSAPTLEDTKEATTDLMKKAINKLNHLIMILFFILLFHLMKFISSFYIEIFFTSHK